nr:immunoglobulin heavy chain junction region [Mus musculus]NSM08871.1 immunoglobulin heavy chain junction region [Mus musculus]
CARGEYDSYYFDYW